MAESSQLVGKVALITGAAQGIGLGIARVLAESGATVAVADLRKEAGENAVQALRDDGLKATFIEVDAGREESIRQMVSHCVAELGALHCLVNNARPSRRGHQVFTEQASDIWDVDQDVMLRGYMIAAQTAAPHIKAEGGGGIVNLSSTLARSIAEESCSYHVAKAGVEHLTRYLAYVLGPENIRVNAVGPGLVDREGGRKLTDDAVNKAVVELSVPLRRAASAAEIGRAVLFLCSDHASYVTGQTLVVDGGLSLGEPFGVGRRGFLSATNPKNGEID